MQAFYSYFMKFCLALNSYKFSLYRIIIQILFYQGNDIHPLNLLMLTILI